MTDFDFEVWTPGTVATLCSVPWGADYRDVLVSNSSSSVDDYIDNGRNAQITFNKMTYARAGEPVKIPLPFNHAIKYNYLRVYNPPQFGAGETVGRTFYYFIMNVTHISPNTTQLIIQMDEFQTFYRSMKFGNCFAERGHVAIAQRNSFADNGRKYLTQPEGMDIGGEYQIDRVYRKNYGETLMPTVDASKEVDILVFSTTQLHGNPGTKEDPKLETALGNTMGGLPNGTSMYIFATVDKFSSFISTASKVPWITQGIIAIMAVPIGIVKPAGAAFTLTVEGGTSVELYAADYAEQNTVVTLKEDFRRDLESVRLNNRYRNLKKFLTYPYSVVEVTTYSGAPMVLKPESIGSDDLSFTQFNHVTMPSPRVFFSPLNYNKGHGQADGYDDGAEFLDMQTGFYNLPMFATVNNGYLSTMASQAHSIQYQNSSADWAQQRTMAGNSLSYDQSSAGMNLATDLTNNANSTSRQMTGLQNNTQLQHTGLSAATSIIGGAAMGGGAGAAMGGLSAVGNIVGSAIDISARNSSTNISTANTSRQTALSNSNTGYVRDTNKQYADWAAKGDYSNAIASINAKVQDARLTQPTTSGQSGGDAAVLSAHRWELVAKVKMLQEAAMNSVGEYWLRYGYAINRFMMMPSTLNVMEKFTYWRVKELYVRADSDAPESARQTIRAIFEKGVTVWRNPDDIGMVDIANNNPIEGDYLV